MTRPVIERIIVAALVLPMAPLPAQTRSGPPTTTASDTAVLTRTSPGSGKWPLVLPGITYAPETRWAAAIGAFKVTRTRAENADQRPNTYAVRGLYSQKHQVQSSFSLDRWRADNAGRVEVDAAFSRFPNKFFGVRAGLADTAERYTPRTISLVGSYIHRVRPGLFIGGRVAYEDARLVNIASGGALESLLATPAFTGGQRWRTTAATVIASWDTRDVLFYPTRGSAVFLNVGRALGVPGATHQFTRVSLDARGYRSFAGAHTLAVQGLGVVTSGNVPVDNLPALGGASLLRGYFAGRFRDKAAVLMQGEYRTPTWRRLGAVAFAGAGTVAPEVNTLRLDELRTAWGLGLRLSLNADRLNLRIDRGFGRGSRGIYISAGEAF